MSIKLIVTDLDGTLMAPDHMTVTKYTYDVLKNAHDRGVKIAIATGRPAVLTESVTRQIPFVDYLIYANGACVLDRRNNRLVYESPIDNATAVKMINHFLTVPVFFEVYVHGRSKYQFGREDNFINTGFPSDFVEEVAKSMDGYPDLVKYLNGGTIEKITLYGVPDECMREYAAVLENAGLATASSFPGTLEATVEGVNKGSALNGLCTAENIAASEVMAFGDAGNDIEMLKFAFWSFAMGNGSEECKNAARYSAPPNYEDGVAKCIQVYMF